MSQYLKREIGISPSKMWEHRNEMMMKSGGLNGATATNHVLNLVKVRIMESESEHNDESR